MLGSRRGPAWPDWGGITNIVTSAGPEEPGRSGDFLGELSTEAERHYIQSEGQTGQGGLREFLQDARLTAVIDQGEII